MSMDLELKKVISEFQSHFHAQKLNILGIQRDASEQDWNIEED